MVKNTFFILLVMGISLGVLLTSKEKTKEKTETSNLEIIEVRIDLLIIPSRRKGAAIR